MLLKLNLHSLTFESYILHRYQRGSRSISDNLQLSKEAILQKSQGSNVGGITPMEEEEEYDIPEEIENVIGKLYKKKHCHFFAVL